MKNWIRIASVVFFTAIYCFAMGAVTEARVHVDPTAASSSKEKVISELSAKFYSHTAPTEIASSNFNNLPTENFKNPLAPFDVPFKAQEQGYEARSSQYISRSQNVLIHVRKSDTIFPFHYFW